VEDLFKEVTRRFENFIDVLPRYRIELLKRKKLSIEEVGPDLISAGSYQVLNEMRKFRRIFRRAFDYGLEPKSAVELARMLLDDFASF
jgi:hypothetical protein